jgi:rare lipoprotein A (peptidoglycan hydrolase)
MKTRTQTLTSFRARAAALLAIGAFAVLGAVPAQAETGGARTTAATNAANGAGIAWSPMQWGGATWYGPGFYGNRTACGQTLRLGTVGVAHRNLPCGTAVKFTYHGKSVVARVIDRGPYARGVSWDLTNGAREQLGFDGSGKIRYAVEMSYARR